MDQPLAIDTTRVPPSGLIGYLNFSDGRPDPRRQREFNEAFAALAEQGCTDLRRAFADWLLQQCDVLQASGSAAFRDLAQARAVIRLTFERVPVAYRKHHADLLAHQTDAALFNSFALVRIAEAVLSQGGPWEEEERIIDGALRKLNDYVGHRPIAVLETRAQTDYYPHEKVRPVPIYLRGVGAATGKYQAVVEKALAILQATDDDLLRTAALDLNLLEELAIDPRAYDHHHPANRRPNYLFGEWDPHHLDNQGRYRRFVARQTTIDALMERMLEHPGDPEYLFEAGAVFAGTILMATGICGTGPTTFDSSVTLTNLVPKIARYRDAFYERLIEKVGGPHAERLRAEAKQLRQPFGAARQHLNQTLARWRAIQLQERQLALIFAEMGYAAASRERAGRIPTASVRILSEMRLRQTAALLATERGDFDGAAELLPEVEDLLHRGINCGALPDPWSILGFQGLFPLFMAREDSIRDPRIDELIEVLTRQFELYAHLLAAVAMQGENNLLQRLRRNLRALADWWDQFASFEVSDVQRLHGNERCEAALHVADSLARWQNRGEGTNDITFWRQQRDGFKTPAAFAQVVEALLRHQDWRAALALLMAWLSQADSIPLEDGNASFRSLTLQWLRAVLAPTAGPVAERALLVRRFFELLEANADDFWNVPEPGFDTEPSRTPKEETFDAAYEGMVYKDSADDGQEGAVIGDEPSIAAGDYPLEAEEERLSQRLQFLTTLGRLWQMAARWELWGTSDQAAKDALQEWRNTVSGYLTEMPRLVEALFRLPIPQPLAGYESILEFDRRRGLRDQLIDAALAVQVELRRALWRLSALLIPAGELPAKTKGTSGASASPLSGDYPWEPAAIRLERAIERRESEEVRRLLLGLMSVISSEPILFVPLNEGGAPEQILRARTMQALIGSWLERLPNLGLLRETYHLVRLAKQLERNGPIGGKRVSEFDRLFRTGLRAVVETLLDAAASWDSRGDKTDIARLAEILRKISDSFLTLWIGHSQTLRLSVLETVAEGREWESLRTFIRRYGSDLFTTAFLAPANLRGILHQGVGNYLDARLAQEDTDKSLRLIEDIHAGSVTKERAASALETILHAILENYDEYRDYNTTTTQSDYGENLHILLDFLRLKTTYDRYAWRMRPLILAHEVLCRKGHEATAVRWRDSIADFTRRLSTQLLEEVSKLEVEHGVRLRTIRDRLEERFLQPLNLDRLCARVEPAMTALRQGQSEQNAAFVLLEEQLAPLTAQPIGVGLDVPHWLQRMENEVERVRTEWAAPTPEPSSRPPSLTFAELQRQLDEWETPLTGA